MYFLNSLLFHLKYYYLIASNYSNWYISAPGAMIKSSSSSSSSIRCASAALRSLRGRRRCIRRISTRLKASPEADPELQRRHLLDEIYAPFHRLGKNSDPYWELARSGDCWYNHFDPENTKEHERLEKVFAKELKKINAKVKSTSTSISPEELLRLTILYSHQSCALERNQLPAQGAFKVADKLSNTLFSEHDFKSLSAGNLRSLALPAASDLIPNENQEGLTSQVAELRNHIVASHWISQVSPTKSGTRGISETQVMNLNALLLSDTDSEQLYTHGWGPRTDPGDYRQIPIRVRSNPLQIFPYHAEVPAIMLKYLIWRDKAHKSKILHPLLLACKSFIFFESIHPFLDGNGRVGRIIMQDYLMRQGYLPPLIDRLKRDKYIAEVQAAAMGEPSGFVGMILKGVVNTLTLLKDGAFKT